jgi:cytochrome c5
LAVVNGASQDPSTASAPADTKRQVDKQKPHGSAEEGQRIFDQNCSRCHATPQGFSPRISGTVLRHMRVRASLSQQDERALLRFLNP